MSVFFTLIIVISSIVLGKLILLKRDVKDYHNYWQNLAAKPKADRSLTYVALGDSAAQGLGASHPELGYVGLIAEALKSKTKRAVHVTNLSKTGATVDDCLKDQIPELAKLKPDIVTIEIGANDLKNWDESLFEQSMEKLIKALPKHTIISDMPYFGGGRMQDLEQRADRASVIIRALAISRGLKVAPLHRITKERDSLLAYSIDFFHPNNRGYRNWFEAFWSVL